MHIPEATFKKLLLTSNVVTEEQFNSAKEEARRSKRTIENVLMGKGDVPETYLAELLADHFRVPMVDLRNIAIPPNVLKLIPEKIAKERGVIVFGVDPGKNVAKLAMLDPGDLNTIEFCKSKIGKEVKPHITTLTSLKFAFQQYELHVSEDFGKIVEENIKKAQTGTGLDLVKMAKEVQVASLIDRLAENAIALNASDIHFEPQTNDLLIRYRIEGIMREIIRLPKIIHPLVVARVKILANLQIDEHRKPQDGRFKFEGGEVKIDVRVSIIPTLHGEKAEMRLLKESSRPISLQELGFRPENFKILDEEIKKTFGMILSTGPTGAGKTTTLYAILHILNTPTVNIVTIEDPIEYDIAGLNQTQVNTQAGVTFATGLRSLVRQDPDVILVGEIRDNETVSIAINSALTGHLVLSTLHTNDAPTAIPRLIDMEAEPFLVASTLNVVIAQRLVRKICQTCIESFPVTAEMERLTKEQLSKEELETLKMPKRLFRGKGCTVCNLSGYRGIIAIFEVLKVSETIKNLTVERAPAIKIKQAALQGGMTTMFYDGLIKAEGGITTLDEVLRVIRA